MANDPFVRQREAEFKNRVEKAIALLLQRKHLYQSVSVEPNYTYTLIHENGDNTEQELSTVKKMTNNPWSLTPVAPLNRETLFLKPPDLKLYCEKCHRVEAYNLVFADDISARVQQDGMAEDGQSHQLFVFAYKCQSCKGIPEAFLLRRRGLRLTNEGRSPIEHVAVPLFVPKEIHRFVGGAVVAHQSGHTGWNIPFKNWAGTMGSIRKWQQQRAGGPSHGRLHGDTAR